MKLLVKNLIFIILFLSLLLRINAYAGTFASDISGVNKDFGAGLGTAQAGALSGLGGVKVSLYNVDTNNIIYSFALTNSTVTRSNSLSNIKRVNGVSIDIFPHSWYELNNQWAGSENGGFSYRPSLVKTALCGTAPGNGCDATKAFYIVANKLTSVSGLGCYLSEDSAGNLNIDQSCQNKLSKYRIILEPIYAFGISPNFTFYTLKGIAQKGVSDGVSSDPSYGFYVRNAIENAIATSKHGNINQHGLPTYSDTVSDKYAKLADVNSGYGYSIFYLIPGQLEETPTVEEIKNPKKENKQTNLATENLMCNENLNTLYSTTKYSYIEKNNSIQSANPYCDVTCETTVTIDYPNVFTATPAGQNFELVYEPTINAKKTCHAKFDYEQWKINYEAAIKNEQDALKNYNYAKARNEQAENLDYEAIGECNFSCGTEEEPAACNTLWNYSSDSVEYKTLNNAYSENTIYSINSNYCDDDGSITSYLNNTYINPRSEALKEAENTLKNRTQDRMNLEKYNLQCYTSLDSSNTSTTINNEDIFDNGYNTYQDTSSKPYTDGINVKTNIESLTSVASGTGLTYSNYIYGITNKKIEFGAGVITKINTKEFFEYEPILKFKYENGMNKHGNKTESDLEKMLVEAYIVQDTGPHTEGASTKIIEADNILKTIYYGGSATSNANAEYLNFTPYKVNDIYRTVEYSYKFHEGTEYCGNIKGGEIKKCSSSIGNDYITLSNFVKYTNEDGTISSFYNHNYPVSLTAKSGHYNTYFELERNGVLTKIDDYQGTYQCNYEVTNNLFTEEKEIDVMFRSVATDKLDPNNRYAKNKFGENWLTKKGQAVKNIIETNGNDKNNNTSKNTYSPENLEYSFTLTPTIINAIQDYNKKNKYSEYELKCNEAGMECKSTFLKELTQGKVNSIVVQPEYNTKINSFNIDNIRNEWKYYLENGDALGCEKINQNLITNYFDTTENVNNMYICKAGTIKTAYDYNSLYKQIGVLP